MKQEIIDFSQDDNESQKRNISEEDKEKNQKTNNNNNDSTNKNDQNTKNDLQNSQQVRNNQKYNNKSNNLQKPQNSQKQEILNKQLDNEKIKQYDPDLKPFDLLLAKSHAKANMVYQDEIKEDFSKLGSIQNNACPCCNLPIEGQKIPFCASNKEIAHLGPAYPLYFLFFKLSMVFLLILFLFSGIPLIVENVKEQICYFYNLDENRQQECTQTTFSYFATVVREDGDPSTVVVTMNLVTSIILMLFISYKLRKKIQKDERKIDKKDISVSDYTIFVNNIPLDQTKEDIKRFFEQEVNQKIQEKKKRKKHKKQKLVKEILNHNQNDTNKNQDIKIEKIVISYNIKQYIKQKERLQELEIQILEHDLQKEKSFQDSSSSSSDSQLENSKIKNNIKQDNQKNIDLQKINVEDNKNKYKTQLSQNNNNLKLYQLKHQNQQNNKNSDNSSSSSVVEPLDNQVYEERDDLRYKCKKFEEECLNQGQNKINHFSGCAFISFKTERMAIDVHKYFQQKFKYRRFSLLFKARKKLYNGNKLTVENAPEPGAILWENLGVSTIQKLIRRSITLIATIILIGGFFVAQFYLSRAQVEIEKDDTDQSTHKNPNFSIQVLSLVITITILITNKILQKVIQIFGKVEAYSNQTKYEVAVIKKLSIGLFLNTAIIPLIVECFANDGNFFIDGGLVSDITTLVIVDIVLSPIMDYIDIPYLIKRKIKQLYYSRKPHKRINLNQQQANKLYEKQKIQPSTRISKILRTILLTCFYSFLIPNLTILCILSLVTQMYMEWYLIIRRQSLPIPLGTYLIEEIMEYYIDFAVVVFSVSQYMFLQLLYQESNTIALIQLILSVLYWVLPVDNILIKLKVMKQYPDRDEEDDDYMTNKKKLQFEQDYDRSNPVTQTQAIKEYLQFQIDNCQDDEIKYKQEKDEGKASQKNQLKKKYQYLQKKIKDKDFIHIDKQNNQCQNKWRHGLQNLNYQGYMDRLDKKKLFQKHNKEHKKQLEKQTKKNKKNKNKNKK